MDKLRFCCTALNSNIKGILNKDENGYRHIPIGGLDVYNSVGDLYPYEGVQEIFHESSSLMRRVKTGCLKAEEGHPKWLPGMTEDDYADRIMTIEETRVCAHIAEVYLDFNKVSDEMGRPVVAIIGVVRGAGAYGPALEASLDNPREDVCFSIRALTENKRIAGVTNRFIRQIITWDRVTEPGINIARKYKAPSLENFVVVNELSSADMSFESFANAIDRKQRMQRQTGLLLATENNTFSAQELFSAFRWSVDKQALPASMQW